MAIAVVAVVLFAVASVGLAEPTREALLRKADAGLSMAKRSGRNRVCSYDQPIE